MSLSVSRVSANVIELSLECQPAVIVGQIQPQGTVYLALPLSPSSPLPLLLLPAHLTAIVQFQLAAQFVVDSATDGNYVNHVTQTLALPYPTLITCETG